MVNVVLAAAELLGGMIVCWCADPECDLDSVPNEARRMTVRAALNNSFGFGGHNVALVFSKP